jgi:hypothetical protein
VRWDTGIYVMSEVGVTSSRSRVEAFSSAPDPVAVDWVNLA